MSVKLKDLTDMMGMPNGFVQLQFVNQEAEFYGARCGRRRWACGTAPIGGQRRA